MSGSALEELKIGDALKPKYGTYGGQGRQGAADTAQIRNKAEAGEGEKTPEKERSDRVPIAVCAGGFRPICAHETTTPKSRLLTLLPQLVTTNQWPRNTTSRTIGSLIGTLRSGRAGGFCGDHVIIAVLALLASFCLMPHSSLETRVPLGKLLIMSI